MKKLFGIFLFTCLTLNSNAQLLWEISGNGLTQPSYLFGTHHLAPLSITDSIKGFREAFEKSTRIIGELSMPESQTPQAMQMMQGMMMMPDSTLRMLFTNDEFELVNQYVKANLKFDMDQVPTLKPAFITNNIVLMIYMQQHPEFNPQEQMDAHFQVKALEKGKKIAGLESMEFQCNLLFNGSPLKRQAELLVCTLSDIEKTVETAQILTEAYMQQNLAAMLQISEEKTNTQCDLLPEEKEAMIDNRNKTWVKQLPALLKEEGNFIAVGALHLPGESGLIALLQKEGFTLKAVD